VTIPVGHAPQGLLVDQSRHTFYVGNQAGNDAPGTVSVIDTRACNGTTSTGCNQLWPTIATGLGPRALALDDASHTVFSANLGDATASIIRGNDPARRVAVGNNPTDIAFDPTTGTVYVADSFAAPPAASVRGVVSVFDGR
jgi:DNA-binding beta-propeller fold protein YncE